MKHDISKLSKLGYAYVRVSTDKQEELSPDAQIRLIKDYAAKNNIVLVEVFIESAISGRKAEKRPEFMKMISKAKDSANEIDIILVWKFSRFARNQEESIVYKSLLKKQHDIDVVSVSEPLIDGPFGSLIERIIEWMDEYYSIRLSGEVHRGMSEKALKGGYQARPPLGYRIPYHGATPEIVPEEADIVRMIFDKYANEKMSVFALTKYLNSLGLKTNHGKPFEKRSLEYILQNPAYTGMIRWNRTENETNRIKDKSEWIISHGTHPPIIEKELYDKAMSRYQAEYRPKNAKPAEVTKHWLSGVLKCSACGRTLSSCSRARKSMEPFFSFQCYGYLKGKCSCSNYVREEFMVPAVLSALRQVLDVGTVTYELKTIEKKADTSKLDILKNSLSKIDLKEARAKEAYMDGIDTLEEYKANKARLIREKEELEAMIAEYHLPTNDMNRNDDIMMENIHTVYDILISENFSVADKNIALKSIVDKIVFSRDNMHIDVYYYLAESSETPDKI